MGWLEREFSFFLFFSHGICYIDGSNWTEIDWSIDWFLVWVESAPKKTSGRVETANGKLLSIKIKGFDWVWHEAGKSWLKKVFLAILRVPWFGPRVGCQTTPSGPLDHLDSKSWSFMTDTPSHKNYQSKANLTFFHPTNSIALTVPYQILYHFIIWWRTYMITSST